MKYNVEFVGVTPLLMHSCRGANPLDPDVKVLKTFTSKRNKTDEDHIEILRLQYLLHAYHNNDIGFYIPANVIEATIINGAKKVSRGGGKKMQTAIEVVSPKVPLVCDAPKDIHEAYQNSEFTDVRNVDVDGSLIMRIRPRFDRWRIRFDINVDESIINPDEFASALNFAGSQVGICDFRPKYGRFEVKVSRG